jgi:hypothetical protein
MPRRTPVAHRARPAARARGALTALAACLALAAVVTVGAVAMGCGAPTTGVAHFSNATYGISIDVDRRLTQWRTASVTSAGAFEVSFVDAAGAVVGGRHLDALTVSRVDTGTSPSTQQAAQLNTSLRTLGAAMVAKLGSNARAGTVSDVVLNGLTGVVVPYGVTISGRPVVGWLYVLTLGGHMYALTAGATADRWDSYRPLFARAIASFKAN